jgi:hypothetical protein
MVGRQRAPIDGVVGEVEVEVAARARDRDVERWAAAVVPRAEALGVDVHLVDPSPLEVGEGEGARDVEGVVVARVGVDSVAEAGDGSRRGGDLLGARRGGVGRVGAAQVVHVGGVGPEGVHGGVVVVHALREGVLSVLQDRQAAHEIKYGRKQPRFG